MIDKEIIFNKHSFEALGAISPSKYFCLKAMDEFAAKQATEFSKFIWRYVDRNTSEYLREINKGKLWHDGMKNHFSPEELYNLFLEEKTQNQ